MSNSKNITLENLTRYDTKIKEYIASQGGATWDTTTGKPFETLDPSTFSVSSDGVLKAIGSGGGSTGIPPSHVKNANVASGNTKLTITWTDPGDLVVSDDQVLATWAGTKLIMKTGSYPTSITDGTLLVDNTTLNKYQSTGYTVTGLTNDTTYYFTLFPYATNGAVNTDDVNKISGTPKAYETYSFKIDQNESDPASMITYTGTNANYTSAKMNYTTGKFDYGSWKNAFFIKNLKPCMLYYDGTVAYELDPNDYSKKKDGTSSDIANSSFGGNAMVGIPKTYWKIVDNGDNTADIYISNGKVDDDYKCWSHIDNNGNEIDYCYMPIYTGQVISSKMRSLSGSKSTVNNTGTNEITYAKANNTGSDVIWYTEVFCDRQLINLLLLLMGKSTDTQTVFGMGNCNSSEQIANGTMNSKGLFWGSTDKTSGVKVFGMENWWGNLYRRIGGWVTDSNGVQKIKMTYGTSDGSTTTGYNTDGTGYISVGSKTISNGYIKSMSFNKLGLIPSKSGGSSSTYYPDMSYWSTSCYALVGGGWFRGLYCGVFCVNLSDAVSDSDSYFSAALSCKPLG